MSRIVIDIEGMSCGHCTAAVERALKAVPGVERVEVTLEPGQARVEGEGLDPQSLAAAVREEGYEVRDLHQG